MRLAIGLLALGAGVSGAAAQVVCRATADTWIEVPEFGRFRAADAARPGHGSDPHLVISGRNSLALLQFDLSTAKGMTVSRAVLRVYREPDPVPLHTVGISTVSGAGPWSEAAAGFMYAGVDRQPWAYAGSDLTDVTFGHGGSLYTYVRPKDAGNGWYEAEITPAMAHALTTGDQFGLLVDDEKGQTHTRHALGSREGPHAPVLVIEGTRAGRAAPGRLRAVGAVSGVVASTPEEARKLDRTTLRPGNAIVRFGGAGAAEHYELRYSERPVTAANFAVARAVPRWSLDPLARRASLMGTANALGAEVTAVVEGLTPGRVYYFAARAVNETGAAGPVSPLGRYRAWARQYPELPAAAPVPVAAAAGAARPEVWAVPELWKIDPRTGAVLEAAEAPDYRNVNAVWNAASGTVRLQGARNEFVAFQLAVEGANRTGVEVNIAKPLFAANKLPAVFQGGAVQLYREWFVPDDKVKAEPRPWYADPLVPLAGPFDIPARDNAVPGQTVQPVFVDVYIPHDAAPGTHTGRLLVEGGGLRREIAVEVEVLPVTMPDKLNFLVDLNCYSGVERGWNMRRNTPEYRALEVAYHRLAHLNRANLDVLGYSQTGQADPDHAPPLTGEGAQTRVADWSAWEAHFGGILSGSAFRDLPRAGVPVPVIYLPFFENWPGDLSKSYKPYEATVPRTEQEYEALVTRHALTAPPIEESFSREYQERVAAVASEFAGHIAQRGWTRTRYTFFFNNKYYFKRPSQGGRGSSWWLLDEPNHRDDVRALAYLGSLVRRGLAKHPGLPIVLRTDVSRVEWLRDLMPGEIDINCVSQHLFDKSRYMLDDRRRMGREFWHYSSTNHPRDSNVAMQVWCWKVWAAGGDGIVPWNTVAGAQAWERAEPLTVFYVGTKLGSREPFASLRLKAFRRGQQDVEYLALLARRTGWDREAVARAVTGAVDFGGAFRQQNEEDAGSTSYRKVTGSQLDGLRRRVARALVQ